MAHAPAAPQAQGGARYNREDLVAMSQAMGQALAAAGGAAGAAPAAPAGVGQGGRKVPAFDSLDPTEWKTWKNRFSTIAQIAGWNDLRARQELFASMTGVAAKVVSDIAIIDPAGGPPAGVPPRNLARVLRDYENRFVTAEASDQAKAEFNTAQQLTDESLLEWHSRLRDLFLRAYPGAEVDNDPGGQMLRDRFTGGLDNREIKVYVYDRRPANYRACLADAQRKQATLLLMSEDKRKIPKGQQHVVAAIGTKEDVQCYLCQGFGHMARDCAKLGQFRELLRGKPRKGGQGQRGSKGKKPTGPNPAARTQSAHGPRKFVASLDKETEEKERNKTVEAESAPSGSKDESQALNY